MFARHGLPKHIKSDNGPKFNYYDTNVTWRRNESHNNTRLYCGHKQMTNWKGKFGVKILDRGTKTWSFDSVIDRGTQILAVW